jgi:hypothetical protein
MINCEPTDWPSVAHCPSPDVNDNLLGGHNFLGSRPWLDGSTLEDSLATPLRLLCGRESCRSSPFTLSLYGKSATIVCLYRETGRERGELCNQLCNCWGERGSSGDRNRRVQHETPDGTVVCHKS